MATYGRRSGGGGSAVINTVSTGLTLSSGTLTNDLSTGVAGGQSVIGGTATGNSLTLRSNTSDDGLIVFGSTSTAWVSQANVSTGTVLGVGTSSSQADWITNTSRARNGGVYQTISNSSATAGAAGGIVITQSASAYGNNYIFFALHSTAFTTAGIVVANSALYEHVNNTSAPMIFSEYSGGSILFATTTSRTTRMTISNLGSLIMGAGALATTATDGYMYVTSCAGTPTGVPTAVTGMRAVQWDTTNKKLYVYDGGWLGGTVPGVFI